MSNQPATYDRMRDIIRSRIKSLGISEREASRRAGFNLGYVGEFLKGDKSKEPAPARILKLAEALDISVAQLKGESPLGPILSAEPTSAELIPLYMGRVDLSRAWSQVPSVASAYLPVLPILVGVAGAYAVVVPNEYNSPRYFVGETVYMDPTAPVRPGDFVFLRNGTTGESTIGRVAELSDDNVSLIYLSAPEGRESTETVDMADVAAMHKIVGSVG